jgi:hypothetical protein
LIWVDTVEKSSDPRLTREAMQDSTIRPAHVGEVQVQQDNVVVVHLAEVDTLFAEARRVDVKAFPLQHQLDALRGGPVVLDEKNPHL